MAKDVFITPASGLIDFKDTNGVSDATIQLDDSGNLIINNPAGVLSIGNTAANLYIGDGTNSVDIIFEQSGKIRALTGKTLTIGQSDSSVAVASPATFSSTLSTASNITVGPTAGASVASISLATLVGVSFPAAAGTGYIYGTNTDGASATLSNMQIRSWYGIGFGPSISGQTIPINENSTWINVRDGSLGTKGTITLNHLNNATAIANGGTSGTGNIGASGATFNTVFAKATTAQYADLAEKYLPDAMYEPGTVVIFGGKAEVTVTENSHDTRVAGIVSTDPGFLMNEGQSGGIPVALTGRVPCRVLGPVSKGDVLVTSNIPGVAQRIDNNMFVPGCVIGKALSEIHSNTIESIEVVVGRF